MDKKEFKNFCDKEFSKRGFIRCKNMYYRNGEGVLCSLNIEKSNYGEMYYVNYDFYIGNYVSPKNYPVKYDPVDLSGRFVVMSKTQTHHGKTFMTALIEYEEYTAEELRPFFDEQMEDIVLPPLMQGKKYLLEHVGEKYFLTLRREEVMKKLQE